MCVTHLSIAFLHKTIVSPVGGSNSPACSGHHTAQAGSHTTSATAAGCMLRMRSGRLQDNRCRKELQESLQAHVRSAVKAAEARMGGACSGFKGVCDQPCWHGIMSGPCGRLVSAAGKSTTSHSRCAGLGGVASAGMVCLPAQACLKAVNVCG